VLRQVRQLHVTLQVPQHSAVQLHALASSKSASSKQANKLSDEAFLKGAAEQHVL
jgi:hypothetical protein